jgi:drug/metabolite transporter (DMT)-like permease
MSAPAPASQELSPGASIATAVLCVIFGGNAVALKITMGSMGAFTNAGFRFGVASIAITIWAMVTNREFKLKQGQLVQVGILALFFVMQSGLFHVGLNLTSASRGTLLANLQPFLVLILAHFFVQGDKISFRKLIGITLGFLGVASLFLNEDAITDRIRAGDQYILLAVLFWAGSAVYVKRIIHEFRPFQLVLYPMYAVAPCMFLAGFLWDEQMIGTIDTPVVLAFLYQSLISASLGFVAWNGLQQKYDVVALHSYVFIMPITGVALGGVMLGENVATLGMLAALVLIVAGIVVVSMPHKKKTANSLEP